MTVSFRRRFLWAISVPFQLVITGCFRDGPTEPPLGDVVLSLVSGDEQFGPASQFLIDALTVVVRREESGQPVSEVVVDWEVTEGAGAEVEERTVASDSTGLASVRLKLGGTLGRHQVRAWLRERPDESVEFLAWAVLPPELSQLSVTGAMAGDVITLEGENFSAIPDHNVVLFSGIRGAVTGARVTQLEVVVPPCLPTRAVDVSVRLGGESSSSILLAVAATTTVLDMAPGSDTTLIVENAPACLRLGSVGSQGYLAVVQSASDIGAARFDYTFTGLREGGVLAAPGGSVPSIRMRQAPLGSSGVSHRAQADWDSFVRAAERHLPPRSPGRSGGAAVLGASVPTVGELKDFHVLQGDGSFEEVTAEVRFVSSRAAFYEDVDAVTKISQTEFGNFGQLFDDPIFPVDVGVFGQPSDLDGNGRIIILVTPSVNRLAAPGSSDFVGGFFFGLDLRPDLDDSNAGEIFYVLAPDPTGAYGNVRTPDFLRRALPPILAHEFQHMIHYKQRVLDRGASRAEALWLSEGLAQIAEDLVGEELHNRGDPVAGDDFQRGNWQLAELYLEAPSEVSLIGVTGQGTLEERGAWWLFLRYLRGQAGGNAIITALTQTTLSSIDNVEVAMQSDWPTLFSDWGAALELERQLAERSGLTVREALQFRDIDLVDVLGTGGGGFPLQPVVHGSGDFAVDGRLWSSSGAHFLLLVGEGGLATSLAGPLGGPASPEAAMLLKIVRLF